MIVYCETCLAVEHQDTQCFCVKCIPSIFEDCSDCKEIKP